MGEMIAAGKHGPPAVLERGRDAGLSKQDGVWIASPLVLHTLRCGVC
jgi:hypothetical protein